VAGAVQGDPVCSRPPRRTPEAKAQLAPLPTSRWPGLALPCPAPPCIGGQVEGDGFLYKMVRHICGALVAVGEGRLPVAAVARMLEVGSNAPPGTCASRVGG
jgi:hypothetical protein